MIAALFLGVTIFLSRVPFPYIIKGMRAIIFLLIFEKAFTIAIRSFNLQKRLIHNIFRKISKLSNKTKEIYKKIFKNVVNRRKKA